MTDSKQHNFICPIAGFLVKCFMDKTQAPDSRENRTRLGMLAGWVGAVLSLLLAAVKGWLGLVSGSISMVADATNNLTDVGSSLVIALGFQWSRKPPDEEHPFGHGRIEAVTTLVLAMALILVGAEVAHSGISRLINPKPMEVPTWLLIAVGVTIIVKSWMALFARKLAKMTQSQVLEADAWNHSFDIVCTVLVVVALFGHRIGWNALDGWTAIGVAGFILYTGVLYARDAIDTLLGKKPDPDDVRVIHETVSEVAGVMGIHEIMIHQYGDVKMVSFHVEVAADLGLMEAHNIAEEAEAAVEQKLNRRALAHVDPVDRSHPLFKELNEMLHTHVENEPELVSVHDLRAIGEKPPFSVSFDLVTDMETLPSQYDHIYSRCLDAFEKTFSERVGQLDIGIEATVESAPMVRKQFELKME